MIGQGELRTPHASRLTPHASRLTPHASRRALTRTKTICPPFGGHNKCYSLRGNNSHYHTTRPSLPISAR